MSREYPDHPLVGVGAVVFDHDRVLLVQRKAEPLAGQWSFPGGVLELGETLENAVARETREETGLAVRPLAVVEVVERIFEDQQGRSQYHYVIVDYLCRLIGGELKAGEDAAAARWFSPSELDSIELTAPAAEVIRKARAMLAGG